MIKNYINAQLIDGEDIVKEFDSDCDGKLSFDEFSNLILPAASPSLRYSAETRKDSCLYRACEPLCYEASSRLATLLQKEMDFQRSRLNQQNQLVSDPDFLKYKTFDDIARGYHSICMPELSVYCSKNGFYVRSEDTEAILRRLDHDADRMLSHEEFFELCGSGNAGQKSDAGQETPKKEEADEVKEADNSDKKAEQQKTPASQKKKETPEEAEKKSAERKKRQEDAKAAAAKEREELTKQIEEKKAANKKA